MGLVWYTNTYHDMTDLVNHEMVNYAKTWIFWERNITFLQNKFLKTIKCHTQRMERMDWISRRGTFCWVIWKKNYAELFEKKNKHFNQISRSSLDPKNSCCSHQQSCNFFSFLQISGHLQTTQENKNRSIRRKRISCNWGKKFFDDLKGKDF